MTLELGLVLEENLIIAPHVETRLYGLQIMAVNILRLWDIFWCSKKKLMTGLIYFWCQTKTSLN